MRLHPIHLVFVIVIVLIGNLQSVAVGEHADREGPSATATQFNHQLTKPTLLLMETHSNTEPILIADHEGDADADSVQNATIILVGLAGVEKSEVIRQLLNWHSRNVETNEFESKLNEYHVRFSSPEEAHVNIVDVSGFVVDRKPEEDAETLALLAGYLKKDMEGRKPAIVLVVSTYDDNRAAGESSHFVQMLKRVQLLKDDLMVQDSHNGTGTNFIFLFTQVGRVRLVSRRGVQKKLDTFKTIIQNYTSFAEPLVAVVGENNAEGYGLGRDENGFTQLSNGELYPKNLFDKMTEIVRDARGADETAIKLLGLKYGPSASQSLHEDPTLREITFTPSNIDHPELLNQKTNFLRQITGELLQVESTSTSEVGTALQETWDTQISPAMRQTNPTALILLQKAFQTLNISERAQLPSTTPEIVGLYLRLPAHEIYEHVLEKAFNIKQPRLYVPLIAGYGYDLTTDSVLDTSPWTLGTNGHVSSPIGYKLPSEYIVTTLNETKNVFHYVLDIQDHVRTRLKDLTSTSTTQRSSSLELADFRGEVRLGYNVKPPTVEEEQHFSVTAIKEFHTFQLEVSEVAAGGQLALNPDFVAWLDRLRPFDPTDRESEKEWRSFFGEYGTHVVLSAYGGGYMQASIDLGFGVRDIEDSATNRGSLVDSLLQFSPRPDFMTRNASVVHSFFGGAPKAQMQSIYQLDTDEQMRASMSEWLSSLQLSPVMMQTSLKLKPISELVSTFNVTVGAFIEEAAQLLYTGKLKFQTSRKPASGGGGSSKPKPKRPTPTAATTTTTTTTTARSIITTPRSIYPREPTSRRTTTPTPSPSQDHSPFTTCTAVTATDSNFILDPDIHVGYGYNMFYDRGVPNSPFKLGKLVSPYEFPQYESLNVTEFGPERYNVSCTILRSHREYILRRIADLESTQPEAYRTYSTRLFGSSLKESSFHYNDTALKPGYSLVTNPYSSNRVSSLAEHLRYKVFIGSWKKLELSAEFYSNLSKLPLPPISPIKGSTCCAAKLMWIQFFKKYGTHVLVSRNVGYRVEVVKYLRLQKPDSSFNFCRTLDTSTNLAIRADNSLYNTVEHVRDSTELGYLNIGMKFEELSTIVRDHVDFVKAADIDRAILMIWDTGAECQK